MLRFASWESAFLIEFSVLVNIMAYASLREFIKRLEDAGELIRITKQLSSELELTEVCDRVCKGAGSNRALLFENVDSGEFPVLMNAFGSKKRMAWALGVEDVEEIAARISDLTKTVPPEGLVDKAKMLMKLYEISQYPPNKVQTGPVKEVIDKEPDLDKLPILKCWPDDGGRFITLPCVFTKDDEGRRNVGMYRMQVYDSKTTGMHWHLHKGGRAHYLLHSEKGKRMEVAVSLGGDPATTYSATAPLPHGLDEMLFAGFLRGKGVDLVKCETVDLEVPANAEFILEGYVEPEEVKREGPFGDHTGYYSLADDYPVFHLTCITRRKDAIYPATIVGKPPMEDCFMGKATERIFLPLIQLQYPEILDINLPIEGVFHNLCFVRIKKRYPGHARKVMHAIWGMGQMMFTKLIAVFDEDVDIQDLSEVLWRLGNNISADRDLEIVKGPLDILDHASPYPNFGAKLGIDATKKWPEEGHNREWPDAIEMSPDVKKRIDEMWGELGIE
jgi:4-hydroxy-3-polyprenylbenzoate decarboxylase